MSPKLNSPLCEELVEEEKNALEAFEPPFDNLNHSGFLLKPKRGAPLRTASCQEVVLIEGNLIVSF